MLRNKYVAVLVGIVFIIVLANNIRFFTGKKSSAPPVQPAVKSSGVPVVQTTKKDVSRRFEQQDKSQWKRDPFNLAVHTAGKPVQDDPAEGLYLMGILKRDGRSHVLINGKVYGENDRIDGVVIREIRKHSIVIVRGSQKEELFFADYKVLKEKAR